MIHQTIEEAPEQCESLIEAIELRDETLTRDSDGILVAEIAPTFPASKPSGDGIPGHPQA